MKHTITKFMGVALTFMVASGASVAETYKPAMFDFSGEQFSAKLSDTDAAELKGASVVLYCQSEVGVEGDVNNTKCYDKDNTLNLVSSAEKQLNGMAFSPAQVNGKNVPVRVSYRVGLSADDSAVQAVLIPNLGSMQERYGRDYIAPQERLDKSNWYAKYNDASWVNGSAFLGHGPMARVAATVDEKGKTDVVREMDTERAYKRDVKIVKNALRKSSFIPGFVDGRPVSMGYLAVVNYGESGEAVSSR